MTPHAPQAQPAFPYQPGRDGRTATADEAAHIRSLVEQLLFTRPGERPNRPTLGCGLAAAVFAVGPEQEAATRLHVQSALHQWLGDLLEPGPVTTSAEEGVLHVEVTYRLRRTGELRHERFSGRP